MWPSLSDLVYQFYNIVKQDQMPNRFVIELSLPYWISKILRFAWVRNTYRRNDWKRTERYINYQLLDRITGNCKFVSCLLDNKSSICFTQKKRHWKIYSEWSTTELRRHCLTWTSNLSTQLSTRSICGDNLTNWK